MVSAALQKHLRDDFTIAIHALHLIKRALVMIQSQPLHAVQDSLHRLWRGALQVGVFDTQNEGAAKTARIGPREKRRAGATHMQVTSGTRGKTGAYSRHTVSWVAKGRTEKRYFSR